MTINLAKPPRLNNHRIALLVLLKGKGRDIRGDYSDTSKHITNTLTEFTETTQTEVVQYIQSSAHTPRKEVGRKRKRQTALKTAATYAFSVITDVHVRIF